MDKIRNINKYIDTVKNNSEFFKNYYYHSLISLNLIQLDSILNHGILCKSLIEQKELINIYTHSSDDFDSKNGNTFVSLTQYTDDCSFNEIFESFSFHTLTSISLLVNKNINISKEGERKTYFDDEIFCFNKVDKTKLEGIILPEHLSNLMVNNVNCLPNDISCFTRHYINHWLTCVEDYFKNPIPNIYIEELKVSFKRLWNIINEYELPERWIQSAIKEQRKRYGKDLKDILAEILQYFWTLKYGIENPKYLDIVFKLNKNNLPIYEIKEKCLKKIY